MPVCRHRRDLIDGLGLLSDLLQGPWYDDCRVRHWHSACKREGIVSGRRRQELPAGWVRWLLSGWAALGRSDTRRRRPDHAGPARRRQPVRPGDVGATRGRRSLGLTSRRRRGRGRCRRRRTRRARGLEPGRRAAGHRWQPMERAADSRRLHRIGARDDASPYALTRQGVDSLVEVAIQPVPRGRTCALLGACAGRAVLAAGRRGVRLSRPGAPVSLHFLWLTVAFFASSPSRSRAGSTGSTTSSTGPTWSARFCCRRSSSTSRWCFPDRPRVWASTAIGTLHRPVAVLPAVLLGLTRVVALARAAADAPFYVGVIGVDRPARAAAPVALLRRRSRRAAAGLPAGAVAHGETAAAVGRLGHAHRRDAVRGGLRAAVLARGEDVDRDGPERHPAGPDPAGLRERDRALPAPRRRGHRQAPAGLVDGRDGDRGDLHGALARGRGDLPAGFAQPERGRSPCWRRWWSSCSRARSPMGSRRRSTGRSTAIGTTTAGRWSGSPGTSAPSSTWRGLPNA